eukprot:2880516-Amphidinium_carterae.2
MTLEYLQRADACLVLQLASHTRTASACHCCICSISHSVSSQCGDSLGRFKVSPISPPQYSQLEPSVIFWWQSV